MYKEINLTKESTRIMQSKNNKFRGKEKGSGLGLEDMDEK